MAPVLLRHLLDLGGQLGTLVTSGLQELGLGDDREDQRGQQHQSDGQAAADPDQCAGPGQRGRAPLGAGGVPADRGRLGPFGLRLAEAGVRRRAGLLLGVRRRRWRALKLAT